MITNQISVFLENRAGQLSGITKTLYENGIDLRAIHIAETTDYGVIRLIADDMEKAVAALKDEGYLVSVTEVAQVSVPDEPGGLYSILKKTDAAGINIEYMYSVFDENDGKAVMVFKTDDVGKLETTIEGK